MGKIIYFPDLNSGKDSQRFKKIKDFFGEKHQYIFVDWQGHHHIPALLNTIKREYAQDGNYLTVGDSVGANFACQFCEGSDYSRSHLLLINPVLHIDQLQADFHDEGKAHLKNISPKDAIIICSKSEGITNLDDNGDASRESVKIINADAYPGLENLEDYLLQAKKIMDDRDDYARKHSRFLHKVYSAFLGLAIGDALGVPVEFEERGYLQKHPVEDFQDGGTHGQKLGTFSDDSSMAFCLAENLAEGYDIKNLAENFVRWYKEGFWSARGEVFDIGIATREALERIRNGVEPLEAGGNDEYSNGNGSLMRILPLLFYIHEMPVEERFRITREVSSITHAHIRSVTCCFYYLEFARHIFSGKNLEESFEILRAELPETLENLQIPEEEVSNLDRLFSENFKNLPEEEIRSSGYVVHTLEASIWCLLNTGNYRDAVLKAVNLGDDTDTTGCVTGGLAGLHYGLSEMGRRWKTKIARRFDIQDLAERLTDKFLKK